MSEPRMRANLWRVAGAMCAGVVFAAVSLANGLMSAQLHMHVSRKLITAGALGAAAFLMAAAVATTALVAHARQQGTASGFFMQPVLPKPSAWRFFATWFAVYAGVIALIMLLMGIVFP